MNAATHRPVTHVDHLMARVPDLARRRIIDVGAGRGKFLFAAAERGFDTVGLERNPAYIEIIRAKAKEKGVVIDIVTGSAELMPFADSSFGFANVAEVIEHVDDPETVLSELARVLAPGGMAYMSVPNRFGIIDPHYHLLGINLLPRQLADALIRAVGKSKADGPAGRQRLGTMHYYTLRAFRRLAARYGFRVRDIREERIRAFVPALLRIPALILYRTIGYVAFDTFHVVLELKRMTV